MQQYASQLSDLLKDIVDLPIADSCLIHAITLDSREVEAGCLFVAMKGAQQHGMAYAEAVEKQGALAIIWESDKSIQPPKLSIPLIEVESLRDHLGLIADRFYCSPSKVLKVIGITGTDGKTSVSHFLAQSNERCAVIGTIGLGLLNNMQKATHTTPDVLSVHKTLAEMKRQGVELVAMEVSSHALDQGRVANVDFDVAVLTNLSRDHLDYHKTVEAYADAKAKLFTWSSLKASVINLDDNFGLKTYKKRGGVLLGYGVGAPENYPEGALIASNAVFNNQGISATIQFEGLSGNLNASVLGRFNLSNLLATLGAMLALGGSLDDSLQQLRKVQTVAGRMEKIKTTDSDFLTVVDFAHTPNALESVLKALREHTQNNLICVFGCGGDRDAGKRPLMAEIAERNADIVIVTDDNPRAEDPKKIIQDIVVGFKKPRLVRIEHDRAEAIKTALYQAKAGDAVLIAGKGHENEQILATETIPFNDREQASKYLQELAA